MFWLGVNLWGNLSGQGKATFTHLSGKNPTTIKTDLGGFWGQLELALLGRLTRQTHVSLSANYNHSVDTNTNRSFGGRLNIQHTW
jgi:hypothetical protein